MGNIKAIVLAAGKGTRMKSEMPKVLHRVCGRPMLAYPLDVLRRLRFDAITVVVGHKAEEVKKAFFDFPKISFAVQEPQLGTGHAVMCAMKTMKAASGDILILSGDVPLIKEETIKALQKIHSKGADVTFISMVLTDPTGYGRVVRDESRKISAIIEHKDLLPEQKNINEVNSGIYLMRAKFLKDNLKHLGTKNRQKEYYLPDLVRIAAEKGKVSCLTLLDASEVMGINNREELAKASAVKKAEMLSALMQSGVTFIAPEASYIDFGVKIGMDTIVHPGAHVLGSSVVGKGCVIEEGAVIRNSIVGDLTVVKCYSVLEDAIVGKDARIGPFARLRPGTKAADSSHIGNFVEIKNSSIGKGSKANHLTYIGDSTVGSGVNIGAGVITCNYDGVSKHRTVIQDNAFVGSDSQLVAPVTIGKGAYIGSGSTITKNVPPGSLALTRSKQSVIEGWAKKRAAKNPKKKGKK
ncbi:MAG: bifunctional UDP-N-acetylglucosamine diphosphorylase/glucosamine-1-phosphate N-acetyltransferase GlmU [Deltaproteobacteria bacterium]|nr:bifunctional UDP-N-acetylglucosamine diphosphorylase/glucosamine-1-phosphate N-acetyltransferase GlmU [Deltaproteobacteria bacterium]